MIYSVCLPMIVVGVLALAGPVVSRNLAPSTSTRFLSALAVLSAAATIGTLVLLAVGGMVKMLPLLGIGADRERLVGGRDESRGSSEQLQRSHWVWRPCAYFAPQPMSAGLCRR